MLPFRWRTQKTVRSVATIAVPAATYIHRRENRAGIEEIVGEAPVMPRKRGRKGPVKLKGEVLEFALAQKKENSAIDPGHLAALIQERYGIAIHRTTVLRGLKKKLRSPRKEPARSIRRGRRPRAGDL